MTSFGTIGRMLAGAGLAVLIAACATAAAPDETASVVADAADGAAPEAATAAPLPTRVSDPKFTEDGIAALEAAMAQHVEDGHVYGIHTLLVQGGEVASSSMAGIRRFEDQAPITDDTIYRIYSMTKPITGVALMMLWEEGAFTLDDPITKFVPEFENLRVMTGVDESGAPILVDPNHTPTMREVMSHTAGFAYGLFGDDPANTAFREQQILASPDLETFIGKVADVPLLYQPGTDWAYSAAVDVQGYVVQKISGQRFGAFLEERLFAPLGMKDTAFYVSEDKLDRFSDVFGYHPETKEFGPYKVPSVAFLKDTIAMESGGGGLTSTMDDYARFCQMLLSGGELDGVRILKTETVDLMTTDVLPEGASLFSDGTLANPDTKGHGFGLDFGIILDPEASMTKMGEGTYYWGGAAGTWFWIDPINDLYFIGMIQRFAGGGPDVDFRRQSADLVYEALVE